MAGSIFIPLISVFDGKGVSQAKTGLAAIAGAVKGLKGAAVAAAASMATVGALGFVKDSVTAARDLERNMVGLENVFESLNPNMSQFSKDAQAIGLSQIEASRASTFLGSVLKQSGFTMEDTAEQTKNLVRLASDLAITYGYDVSEALTGMTALFRGEYDPIEKFGVAMKQAEVNALLAARGQKGLTGETLRNAQAQARLDLLYSRSQDAQGAYIEQSDSLFVAQKNLQAGFENMKASLGESLLKPLASLLQAMQPVVSLVGQSLAPVFEVLAKVITTLAPLFQPLIEVVLSLFDAFAPIFDLLVSLLEPLMIPLVGVVELLANTMKLLTPIITLVANVLKAVLVPVLSFFSYAIGMAVKGVAAFIGSLASIPVVGEAFKSANDALQSFIEPFDELTGLFLNVGDAQNNLVSEFEKPYPDPDIDGITGSYDKVSKAAKESAAAVVQAAKDAAEKMQNLLEDALNIQKSIMNSANITELLDDTSTEITKSIVYVKGKFKTVVSGITQGSTNLATAFKGSLDKIKTFYTNLNKLSKANLDPELISQLVSAGPELGNATAEAILASGAEGIQSLNDTYADIKVVAGNIGANVATSMQTAGQDVGNGLIDGIAATATRLKQVAEDLATDFANTFNNTMDLLAPAATGNYTKAYETPVGKTIANINTSGSTGFGYTGNMPFVASAFAGISSQYKLTPVAQIKNPYDKKTNPKGYYTFKTNQEKASNYNISVNVAPTATNAEVGNAIVAAIRQYERVKGSDWRKN